MADPVETAGYRTDVRYLRTFSADLSPASLRLVAALNGFAPPPADDFDYCELGCGNGDTTATLAACYPSARFLGVDMNAEHIAFAQGLARQGGLSNVGFLQADFEALAQQDLPGFDYVTAHGLTSWIAPEKRRRMIEIAAQLLHPGGVLFVSYNAMPGWAAVEPLRRLMLDASPDPGEPTLTRARRGVALARRLAEGGAEYFAHNPASGAMLETMREMGLPYVVHEYFQPSWHPLYFADLSREMAGAGLHFIGQLPLHLNYRDLAVPQALMGLFGEVKDRLAFESLKDFALNELFRRDVYIKGEVGRSAEHTDRYLDETPFGTLMDRSRIKRVATFRHRSIAYDGPVFDALIDALSAGAATAAELAELRALENVGAATIRQKLLELLLGEQIVPMRRTGEALPFPGQGPFSVPIDHNRVILKQPLAEGTPTVLASDVAGTGLVVSMLEALCLRIVTEVEPADRPAWIRAFIARRPLRLHAGGRAIEQPEEQAALIEKELADVLQRRVPKLIELGVLER
ncbi:MAG: class I SAM-dependent methyltransferase [Byssovorax sp.]